MDRAGAWLGGVLLFGACATVQTGPGADARRESVSAAGEAPYVHTEFTLAGGSYSHQTNHDSGVSSGRTDGGFARLRGEFFGDSGMGAGLSLEGARSDGDLFENRPIETLGHTGDIFLYSVYYLTSMPPAEEPLRIPLRIGPYYHDLAVENDVSPTRVRWSGLGVRLECEPEYWFLTREDFSFGVVGGLSGGLHVSDVDLRGGASRTTLNGNGYTLGAEAGVQAGFGHHVTARLGYLFRESIETKSESENRVAVSGASATFSGLELSIGFRF